MLSTLRATVPLRELGCHPQGMQPKLCRIEEQLVVKVLLPLLVLSLATSGTRSAAENIPCVAISSTIEVNQLLSMPPDAGRRVS